MASHLLYTQPGVLSDSDPEERARGIAAGLAFGRMADATVVYLDRGISAGMRQGIASAAAGGRPVVYRQFGRGTKKGPALPAPAPTVGLLDQVP